MHSTLPATPSSPYGPLADQMRRALLGAYLQLTEAAARDGNDRRQRFRCARAECNEAAAAIEAAFALGFLTEPEANAVLADLDRLAAMLPCEPRASRVGGLGGERPSLPPIVNQLRG